MTSTIKILFRWDSLQPDRRQWKPSNPLIEPIDIMIALDVPLKHEYIYNAEDIIQKQLSNEPTSVYDVNPVLTPKGMKYCIDQFENVMRDEADNVADEENPEKDEWEELPDQTDEWK